MTASKSFRVAQQGKGALKSVLLLTALGVAFVFASTAFVGNASSSQPNLRATIAARAESAPAPAPAPTSTALVLVTEENKVTAASVVPGLLGLLWGGAWVGGALFVAGAYLSRQKDSDIAAGIKGVAGGTLEALNFGNYVNDKYEVTGKIGSAFSEALNKSKAEGNETASSVSNALDGVGDAVTSFDKDVGIKDTLGSFFTTASDLAFQAVDKAIELDKEYKVTEQIVTKVNEQIESSKSTSAKSSN